MTRYIISAVILLSFLSAEVLAQQSVITILVLPPYDKIANAGASPDTQKILEASLSNRDGINVIRFPYKKLMNVSYQMVYDKKYCAPIVEKVPCDIIVMTQLVTKNETVPGLWPWAYMTRVYDVRTGKQVDSIKGDNLKSEDIPGDIKKKSDALVQDIIRVSGRN